MKGVGLQWWKVHFTQDTKSPLQSLWLRTGIFQWCFTCYWALKSVPFLRDQRSQMVHQYSFCDMTCLGVLSLPLDGMLVHCRWPPAIVRLPSLIGQYHLHSWVERDIVRVRCRAWEHDTATPVWLHFGPIDPESNRLTIRPSTLHLNTTSH